MLGESKEKVRSSRQKRRDAARDALIVLGITLVSSLIAEGYPPTPKALYLAALNAVEMYLVSLAYAYGIHLPKRGEESGGKEQPQ